MITHIMLKRNLKYFKKVKKLKIRNNEFSIKYIKNLNLKSHFL